jgi:sugar O-acyltransferase (sialic acid O-acetyltransferase NeuD family)
MREPNLILIGAGGHARSCIDVIEEQGRYKIAGLVGLIGEKYVKQSGYDVIANDNEVEKLAQVYQFALITVGQIQSVACRLQLYQQALDCGFQFPVIIAPTAHVSRHAVIGDGSIVMHGAIVNAGARVGSNCIVNTRAIIEHDATVENHCHVSTGAILNGSVTIDAGSFIGSCCIIREGVSIGKGCLVGMGLTVRHNLADFTHFTGNRKNDR